MPRPPAFVLWLATLASGVALGLALGHRGPTLSAQATQVPPQSRPIPLEPKGDEAALYRDLAVAYERFQGVDRAFELVAKAVSPSVVHITAKKDGPRDDGDFGRYEETGSGVIVGSDGAKGQFVLTNNHVVQGAASTDIHILLHDGRILKPERVWSDPKADVAVLKLAKDGFPCARMGNSDEARVGSWVMALGSPFGLTHSVSHGIISARGRFEPDLELEGVEHQEFLQTDAAINPGNSGGPLVNMKGEVVGINTAIASNGGGSEGVGFSIPINLAKWAMTQLVAGGKVNRGAMGVNLQELTPSRAADLGLERPRGARIAVVHEGSPAIVAGLRVGDVVLRFNGVEVVDNNHLINLVSIAPIGQASDLLLWRDRKVIAARVTIADRDAILAKTTPEVPSRRLEGPIRRSPRPSPAPVEAKPAPNFGLSLSTLDEPSGTRLFANAPNLSGVLVAKVDPASPFAPYLKAMDVIQSIRNTPVRTPQNVLDALKQPSGSPPLEISLQRMIDGTLQSRSVKIP